MGKCQNCGTDINLKDKEQNCPDCGNPPYNCWQLERNKFKKKGEENS